MIKGFLCLAVVTGTILSSGRTLLHAQAVPDDDPPEALIGERLFREGRFSQFFSAHSHGDANAVLPAGDPVMETTVTIGSSLSGPYAGQGMNCRACHLVNEHKATRGNRTYSDFARRSPIPDRGDGRTTTPRNAPGLVSVTPPNGGGSFLHLDGEFVSAEDLVIAGLLGRNNGWLPNERAQAIAHVARIIREDNGAGALAAEFGGRYSTLFTGTDAAIPPNLRLPEAFRLDVAKATDEQILSAIGVLMKAYLDSLTFQVDLKGCYIGSPFDQFLIKNNLPREPKRGESPLDYSRRLLRLIEAWPNPQFVKEGERTFTTHDQKFVFGEQELAGLKIFFRMPGSEPLSVGQIAKGGIGNCIACHHGPNFSDFKFHNTGATQEEYDALHCSGSFAKLPIPTLDERNTKPNALLPPSPEHPMAMGTYFAVVSAERPELVDLGLWNIFANPDHPKPQKLLRSALANAGEAEPDSVLLEKAIARFKTSSLRDLGQSAPYLHTGRKDTIEDVVRFYREFSNMARAGQVRNADSEMLRISLSREDEASLSAFLRSLNEDYEK